MLSDFLKNNAPHQPWGYALVITLYMWIMFYNNLEVMWLTIYMGINLFSHLENNAYRVLSFISIISYTYVCTQAEFHSMWGQEGKSVL